MKMPFFWLAAGSAAGMITAPWLKVPGTFLWGICLAGLPILWSARGRRFFLPIFLGFLFCVSALYARLNLNRPARAIEFLAQPGFISVDGRVRASEVQREGRRVKVSLVLEVRNFMQGRGSERRFLESQGNLQVFLSQPQVLPDFGDEVRVFGTLERPKGAMNPGQFDYKRYLADQEIFAVLKGYGAKSVRVLSKGHAAWPLRALFKLRRGIAAHIERLFDEDTAVFFKALIVGERKQIPSELRDNFMKTGTSHIWAISGMNIALVAGSFYLVLIMSGVRQKWSALAGILVVVLYVFVAGAGIPVQRSGWMAGAAFLALVVDRENSPLNMFFFAMTLLLWREPGVLANISFQLSFMSVLVLIIFLRQTEMEWVWADNLKQSLIVTAGTFPIVLYHFNIFSLISLLANVLAIPLFHLALLLAVGALGLQPVPGLGAAAAYGAEFFLKAGLGWIERCASLTWGYWFFKTPSLWHLAGYYGLLGLFCFFQSATFRFASYLRILTLSMLLLAGSYFFKPVRDASTSVTLLAAGANELMHFHFPSGADWLVNSGRGRPSNQAQWILGPYLRRCGIKRLRGILVTDFYKRHTGGLSSLSRNFVADFFFYPAGLKREEDARPFAKKINSRPLRRGDVVQLKSDGQIRILDIVQGQILFGLSSRATQFLYLPELNEEILKALGPHRPWLGGVRVLILPSLREMNQEDWKRLMDLVDPEYILAPSDPKGLREFLSDRDIRYFDTENHGALTLRLGPADRQTPPVIVIESFLKGPLV